MLNQPVRNFSLVLRMSILISLLSLEAQKTLAGRRASQSSSSIYLRRLHNRELAQLVVSIEPVDDISQEQDLLRRLTQAAAAMPSLAI